MIRLNVMPILEKKGKTRYWLSKQTGIGYPNIVKIANNQSSAIYLETIEVLCQVLECTPNDLFTIDSSQPEGKE